MSTPNVEKTGCTKCKFMLNQNPEVKPIYCTCSKSGKSVIIAQKTLCPDFIAERNLSGRILYCGFPVNDRQFNDMRTKEQWAESGRIVNKNTKGVEMLATLSDPHVYIYYAYNDTHEDTVHPKTFITRENVSPEKPSTAVKTIHVIRSTGIPKNSKKSKKDTDNTSIEVLGLSARSYNSLKRMKLLTVGKLKESIEQGTLDAQALGATTVENIFSRLDEYDHSRPQSDFLNSPQLSAGNAKNETEKTEKKEIIFEEFGEQTEIPMDKIISENSLKKEQTNKERGNERPTKIRENSTEKILNEILVYAGLDSPAGIHAMQNILQKNPRNLNELIGTFCQDKTIRNGIEDKIYNEILSADDGVYASQIISSMPRQIQKLFQSFSHDLIVDGKILKKRNINDNDIIYYDRQKTIVGYINILHDYTGLEINDLLKFTSKLTPKEYNDPASIVNALCDNEKIHAAIKNRIYDSINSSTSGITTEMLQRSIQEPFSGKISFFISELTNEKKISIDVSNHIAIREMDLDSYLKLLKDDDAKKIFTTYLQDGSLKTTAMTFGESESATKEKLLELIAKRPKLKEEKYLALFNGYEIGKETFLETFHESERTYNYLRLIQNASQLHPIEEASKDPNLQPEIRAALAPLSEFVVLEGERVEKEQTALIMWLLKKNHSDKAVRAEDFRKEYNEWIKTLGIQEDESLEYTCSDKRFANFLRCSHFTVYSKNLSIRYYDCSQYDFDELYKAMNLERYNNLEISTAKLFEEFPELMEKYDIRNYEELYNLMLKEGSNKNLHIEFETTPIIVIGKANREDQIFNLMIDLAPISKINLVKEYEKRYGLKRSSIARSISESMETYNKDGIYQVDEDIYVNDEIVVLSPLFTKDYYSFDEIREIYKKNFPDRKVKNPIAVKRLGFSLYETFALRDTYTGIADFAQKQLQNEITARNSFVDELWNSIPFQSEILKAKKDKKIIEFHPDVYYSIHKLEEMGITTKDMDHFCDAVYGETTDQSYFTMFYLRTSGFKNPLFDENYDDCFYVNLLFADNLRFSTRKIENCWFISRIADFTEKSCLLWISAKHDAISVEQIQNVLSIQYGLNISGQKILETSTHPATTEEETKKHKKFLEEITQTASSFNELLDNFEVEILDDDNVLDKINDLMPILTAAKKKISNICIL